MFKVKRSSPAITNPNGSPYKTPTPKELVLMMDRAKKIQFQLDEVKPLYQELDQITFALLPIKDKISRFGAVIVDNFAEKNTQFKTVGMKRFELKWK